MGKLCISMQLIIPCTPCIALVLMTHTCIFTIDHAERGLEEPPESAPVEAANFEQDQGKPGASNHKSLSLFCYSSILLFFLDVH
jgi:hypothetical protein